MQMGGGRGEGGGANLSLSQTCLARGNKRCGGFPRNTHLTHTHTEHMECHTKAHPQNKKLRSMINLLQPRVVQTTKNLE